MIHLLRSSLLCLGSHFKGNGCSSEQLMVEDYVVEWTYPFHCLRTFFYYIEASQPSQTLFQGVSLHSEVLPFTRNINTSLEGQLLLKHKQKQHPRAVSLLLILTTEINLPEKSISFFFFFLSSLQQDKSSIYSVALDLHKGNSLQQLQLSYSGKNPI